MGFVACNAFYSNKAGLANLFQTKDDFKSIKRTTNMLDIKPDDLYELVDATHEEIDTKFQDMCEKILASVPKLRILTGIGSARKFVQGIAWKHLKEVVFKLIDAGVI